MTKKHLVLLSFLIACAAFLRFWGLSERGLLYWDEAYYALEGKTIPSAVSYLAGGGPVPGLKDHLIAGGCILPTGTGKPVFVLLLSAWGLVFGTGDFAGMAMTAFFGVLCVGLVFFAAYKYSGAVAGFSAAFLLAFSGLHVWYSRSLLANSIASFFLLFGLLQYAAWAMSPNGPGARRRGMAAGAVIGLSFMTHYAMLPNLALFAVCEALRLWNARDRFRAEVVNTLVLAAGFGIVLGVCELCYAAVFRAYGGRLGDIAHLTYFQYIVRQFLWSAPSASSSGGWRLYLQGFAAVSGWPASLFYLGVMAGSAWLFIKRPGFGPRVFMIQVWGTLLFWMLNPGINALRAFVAFAPLSAIAGGFLISELAAAVGRPLARGALYISLAMCVLFSGREALTEMLRVRSVSPEVAAWLSAKGKPEVISMINWPLMQFYLGRKIYANHDRIMTWADLERYVRGGAAYLLTDDGEKEIFEMRKTGVYSGLLKLIGEERPEMAWKLNYGERFLRYDSSSFSPYYTSDVKAYPLKVPAARGNK